MQRPRTRGPKKANPAIGNPHKATGITNHPRGEEAAEQNRVHPRGKAVGAKASGRGRAQRGAAERSSDKA
jgi:hypothetical protein